MLKIFGKQSPKKNVEEARGIKVDAEKIKEIAAAFLQDGPTYSVVSAGTGKKNVFSGDFSSESAAKPQGQPLLQFEHKAMQHTAYIRHGGTGELLMMIVREAAEESWHDDEKGAYAAIGNRTQGRLYLNGMPAGVNSKKVLDIAPKVDVGEAAQLGASMVELFKVKQGHSVSLFRRKGNGEMGAELAAYSKLKGGTDVFTLLDTEVVNPIVAIAMMWYNTIDTE